jgi:hypothetical protein
VKYIDLSGNDIRDSIPNEIANLSLLVSLDLCDNELIGTGTLVDLEAWTGSLLYAKGMSHLSEFLTLGTTSSQVQFRSQSAGLLT